MRGYIGFDDSALNELASFGHLFATGRASGKKEGNRKTREGTTCRESFFIGND
jgi:hypothetical protein